MHHRLLILGSEYWMGFALALPEGASFSEEKATKASSSRARVPLKGKGRLLTALGFRALFRTYCSFQDQGRVYILSLGPEQCAKR